MTYSEIRENKIFRYVWKQLSEILTINKYHGKKDVEFSVKIINAVKEFGERLKSTGVSKEKVNKMLEMELGCFENKGYTYDEISNYWRDKVNKLKSDAEEQLIRKALLLQKLSRNEKNPQKSLAISKDCIKYMEAVVYIAENINYNG